MRETGWLIECKGEYWAAGPASRWRHEQEIVSNSLSLWTADVNKAVRFARKCDAETLIHYEGWQHAEAVEHMWVGADVPDEGTKNKTKESIREHEADAARTLNAELAAAPAPIFHPFGCICPPTSEQTCQNQLCPRKAR